MRYEGLEFDMYVAKYFLNKQASCKDREIEFHLTLPQVRNMLMAKKCKLSGVEMTHTKAGKNQIFTDVTIDRIDSKLPYTKENCCAVAYGVNQIKSMFEQGNNGLELKHLHVISNNLKERGM